MLNLGSLAGSAEAAEDERTGSAEFTSECEVSVLSWSRLTASRTTSEVASDIFREEEEGYEEECRTELESLENRKTMKNQVRI